MGCGTWSSAVSASAWRRLVACLGAISLAVGCSKPAPTLSEQIAARYDAGGVVDLASVGPAEWERVCIFAPYSTTQFHGRRALGFDWDMDASSEIRLNEGIALLVFVQGQQVVAFVDHSRGKGDFASAGRGGACYARSAAKFKRKQIGNWSELEAVENALPTVEPSGRTP